MVLNSHTDHVEDDDEHDGDVEVLVGNQLKEEQLTFELWRWN